MLYRLFNSLLAGILLLSLTGCYRKLYYQSIADRVTCIDEKQKLSSDNTTLRTDNTALKSDNEALGKQVQTLTAANQALAAQIIDFKSKTKRFDLFFRQLCCDKTTEHGADEVYIVTLGTKIGSGDILTRAPTDPKAHWDMNDGHQRTDNPSGDSHCITNRALASGELKPGESYYFNVTVFEQDGGTTADYQKLASSTLKASGDPFSVSAGTFIGALTSLHFFFTDSDDWMGMIGVKVTNNDGVITAEWQGKDGINQRDVKPDPDYPTDPNRKEMRMTHDGSNYIGWFGIRYQ